MSGQCCFICASDEGVFLDVTKENGEKLCRQLETCLSVKVAEDVACITKVCHKCGFELEQCETFIQKYHKNIKRYKKGKSTHCAVCCESLRTRYAFDLHKGQSLNNPLQKIQDLFKDKPINLHVEGDLICLSCRYNVDILHDLKKVYMKTNAQLENDKNSNLNDPIVTKVDTIAVSRKTTITKAESIKSHILDTVAIDSKTMARGQSRVSKVKNKKASVKSKLRVCDECHNTVENGSDMFRFYRTGLTVCKTCWINMDPSQNSSRKRARTEHGGSGTVETKLCAVFLKDVLKDSTSKDEKIYRTEKDLQGNTVYIITDESSESDTKSRKSSPEPKEAKEDGKIVKPSNVKKAETAVQGNTRGTKRTTRSAKNDSTGTEQISVAQNKSNGDSSEPSQEPVNTTKVGRRKRKERENTVQVPDKQVPESEGRQTRKKLRTATGATTEQASSISSESSSQEVSSGRTKRKTRSDNVSDNKPVAVDSDAANINTSETIQVLDNDGEASRPTTAAAALDATKSDDKVDRKSYSADETTQEFKSPVRKERRRSSFSTVGSKSLSFETENVSPEKERKNDEHACDECGVMHENKLASMTHLLTHFKQPELKLSKVSPSTTPEDNESTGQAIDGEVDNMSEAEKQSEEVSITVDDEEDVPEKDATEDDLAEKDKDISSKDTTEKDIIEKKTVDKGTPDEEVAKKDTVENITAAEGAAEKDASENDVSEMKSTESAEKEEDTTEKNTVEKEKSDDIISDKGVTTEVTEKSNESESVGGETGKETVNSAKIPVEKEAASNDTHVQELDDENEEDMILKTTPDETGKDTLENDDTTDDKVSESNKNEDVNLTDIVTDDEPKETNKGGEVKHSEDHKLDGGDAEDSKHERHSIGIENLRRNSTDSHKSSRDNAEEETDIEQLKVSDTEATENPTELDDSPVVMQNNIKEKEHTGEDNEKASDSPRKRKNRSPKASRKEKNKDNDIIEENEVESETDIKIVDADSPEITIERDVVPENTVVLDNDADDDNVVEVDPAGDHSNSANVTIVQGKNGEIQSGADKENDKDFAVIAKNELSKSQSGSPRKKPQEDSTTAATEVLQEVFQLATNESQKDQETIDVDSPKHDSHKQTTSNDIASRETRTSADMPSLDAISADVENDDVTLE